MCSGTMVLRARFIPVSIRATRYYLHYLRFSVADSNLEQVEQVEKEHADARAGESGHNVHGVLYDAEAFV
jgi:hypothetical protein